MEPEKPEKTNIELYVPTRDRIKDFGNMGDKYDDVLNRMMDACEPAKEFRYVGDDEP